MLRVVIGVFVLMFWGLSGEASFAASRHSDAMQGCEALLVDESEVTELRKALALVASTAKRKKVASKDAEFFELSLSRQDWDSVLQFLRQVRPEFLRKHFEKLPIRRLEDVLDIFSETEKGITPKRLKRITDHFQVDELSAERKVDVIERWLNDPDLLIAAYTNLRFSKTDETFLLHRLVKILEAETHLGSPAYCSIMALAPFLKGQDTLDWANFLGEILPGFESVYVEFDVPEFLVNSIRVLRPEYQDLVLEWIPSVAEFDGEEAKFLIDDHEILLSDFDFLSRQQKLRLLGKSLLMVVKQERVWPDPLDETQREDLFGKRFTYLDFHDLLGGFSQALMGRPGSDLDFLNISIDSLAEWIGGYRGGKNWQAGRLLFPFTFWGAVWEDYYSQFKVDLDKTEEFAKIQDGFASFAKRHPDLMDSDFGERIFFSATKDPNDLRALIKIYDLHRASGGRKWADSSELLAEISGGSVEFWRQRDPEKNYESVIHQVLALSNVEPHFLRNVRFEASALERPDELAKLFERTAKLLRDGESADELDHWETILGPEKVLSSESIEISSKRWVYVYFQETLYGLSQKYVELDLDRKDFELSFEEYQDLVDRWGDLKPFLTLFKRLHKVNRGSESVETVLNILRAGIEGRFKELKYGKDYSDSQIAFMSPARRRKWGGNVHMVSLAGFETGESPIREILSDRVETILEYRALRSLVSLRHKGRGVPRGLNLLLERIERGSPKELLREWLDERGISVETKRNRALERLLRWAILEYDAWIGDLDQSIEESDLIRLKRASRVALGAIELLKQAGVEDFYRDDFDKLKRSLRAIETAATLNWNQVANDGLIFSILSDDPMFLLTVGQLVPCGSCLDYEDGGMIRALPGYIVDANTKLGASFHLRPQDFEDQNLYQKLYRQKARGKEPDVYWHGNFRQVMFELESGEGVWTKPLEQAYLRRVVRIGKTRKAKGERSRRYRKPGVFAEARYRADHRFYEQMETELDDVIEGVREDLGADSNRRTIYFGATKNPGGTYSDAAEGVQYENFSLRPSQEEQ